jgi:TonB family protein
LSIKRMRRWLVIAALAILGAALLAPTPAAYADTGARKAKVKVTPVYPALAKQINLSGTVRLEVVIAPSGTVKSMHALGGHPLLIEAATEAVRKWKYEPGPESTVVIEFHFNPRE